MHRLLKTKSAFFAFLIISAFILSVYGQTLQFKFINFDDTDFISKNPHIQHGLTLSGIQWAMTADLFFDSVHADYWQPITIISRMIDVSLFGLNPSGHHATNVVLHIMNACLLFYLFHLVSGAYRKSLIVALFFAIHPVQVEAVSWITARKDLLSTFFELLAIHAYLKYQEKKTSRGWAAVYLFFILGLMTKPVIAVLPFLLLIIDAWPNYKIDQSKITQKIPLAVAGAVFALNPVLGPIRAISYGSGGEVFYRASINFPQYLWKALYPFNLGIASPGQAFDVIPVLAGLSIISFLSLTVLFVQNFNRKPYLLAGWLWFSVALLPSAFMNTIADRFMYLPLVGLIVMLTWALEDLANQFPKFRKLILLGLSSVLILCAVQSFCQAGYWKDGRSIFTHSFRVLKNNVVAANNLGNILLNEGKIDEAIKYYETAIQINPTSAKPYFNLANCFYIQKKFKEAIEYYLRAIRLDPNYVRAHYNLANVLSEVGNKKLAIYHYGEAVRADPNFADAHRNLAAHLVDLGKISEAETELRAWSESRPK